MIKADGHIFVLETAHTTYCFWRMETGHLEHLYYGRHLTLPEHPAERDVAPLMEKHTFAPGNTNLCDGSIRRSPWRTCGLRCPPTEKETSANRLWRIVHCGGSTTFGFPI